MNKIIYKIIELNEDTHSIVVRYYTDVVSEEILSSSKRKKLDGTPERTRSDVSITLPIPLPPDDEIEKIILQNFPKRGIDIFEKLIKNESNKQNFKKLSAKLNKEIEKDINDWENAIKPPEKNKLDLDEIEKLLSEKNS